MLHNFKIIDGYCGFKELNILKFERFNLIVGKNGVGKTALLGALNYYQAMKFKSNGRLSGKYLGETALCFHDDIEGGVHHTDFVEMWKRNVATAKRRDFQIFATTHSWDCIEGFVAAVGCNGQIIRLEEVEGEAQTGAVIMNGKDLPIIVRDRIEIR